MSGSEIHRQKELQATWGDESKEEQVKEKMIKTRSQGTGIQSLAGIFIPP